MNTPHISATTPIDLVEIAVAIGTIQEGQKNVVEVVKEFKTEVRHDLQELKVNNRELRKDLNNVEDRMTLAESEIKVLKDFKNDQKPTKLNPWALAGIIVAMVASLGSALSVAVRAAGL